MGLTFNQEMFLGISFIIIIIIMILVKNKTQAMLMVGLIANFLLISSQLVIINERRYRDKYSKIGAKSPDTKLSFVSGPIVTQNDTINSVKKFNLREEFADYQGKIGSEDTNYTMSTDGAISNPVNDILPAGTIDDDFYFSSPAGNALLARDTMLRGHSSRVNPRNNNRSLMEKYVLPELQEEEVKPWWGRE